MKLYIIQQNRIAILKKNIEEDYSVYKKSSFSVASRLSHLFFAKHKVYRFTRRIHRSVEIGPMTFYFDISLIATP